MIVDVLLHPHTVTPLPTPDTANAIVRSTTVAVVPDVVGKYVVSGIGQMLVLEHEVDLDCLVVAPRLAEMPRETCTAHGQSMIEDDEIVALTTFGRDVPGFLAEYREPTK